MKGLALGFVHLLREPQKEECCSPDEAVLAISIIEKQYVGGRVVMDPKTTIRMIDKHSIGSASGLS
jgi:hypothetical protein